MTRLSGHARWRIVHGEWAPNKNGKLELRQRTKLSPSQVKTLIERAACPIGEDPLQKNVWHWLFWSKVDNSYYVALKNEKRGTVITILHINQYVGWRRSVEVASDTMRKVKEDGEAAPI